MTIALNTLTSLTSDTNAASYATPSITPAADRLVLAAVLNRRTAGTATTPTLSGNGLTWVQIDTQTFDPSAEVSRGRLTLFRSMGAAPSAGALTVDFGGVTQLACAVSVCEFSGVNTSGTNGSGAVVQSNKNSGVGVSSLTVTLSAFGSGDNAAFATFAADVNTAITPDTSFTEIHDVGTTAPAGRLETAWLLGSDTSIVGSMSSGSAEMAGIAIEIAAAPAPAPTPVNVMTEAVPVQPRENSTTLTRIGLGVNVYQAAIDLSVPSITPRGNYLAYFDPTTVGWHHEIHEHGGYWTAEMQFGADMTALRDWTRGLMRHVELFDHRGVVRWEGFVNEVRISVGKFELTIGPLMDIGNRVSGIYTPILDETTDPPLTGTTQPTTIAEDTASQALYGIIEKVLDLGEKTDDVAEQIRDAWLGENAYPDMDSGDTADMQGSGGEPIHINVQLLGYVHFLGAYVFNDTTIYSVTTEDKIQTVLEADPNGIISTDYNGLQANGSLTSGYENENRYALDIIRDVVLEADVDDNRWKFGIYAGRKAFYEKIPTTVQYQRHILLDRGEVYNIGGTPLYPWEILPGEWIYYPDLDEGMGYDPDNLPASPAVDYIGRVTFTAPYSVQIEGQKFNRISQFLIRNGIESI